MVFRFQGWISSSHYVSPTLNRRNEWLADKTTEGAGVAGDIEIRDCAANDADAVKVGGGCHGNEGKQDGGCALHGCCVVVSCRTDQVDLMSRT